VIQEKTTLYVDTGSDFAPNQVVRGTIDPSKESFEIHFDLTGFNEIKRLRWDPIEGFNCQVKLSEIQIVNGNTTSRIDIDDLTANAARLNKGWWVFETIDPMFIIDKVPNQIECIRIIGFWQII
jgi:hypothetical protein